MSETISTTTEPQASVLPSVELLESARVGVALRELLVEVGEGGLPKSAAQSLGALGCARQLAEAGLLDGGGRPRFRINLIGRRVFLTDVPEHTRHGGVFPYEDEAVRLLGYLQEHPLQPADAVIDVGVGCGHALLSTSAATRVGIDVSARAGAFMRLNAELNGVRARWAGADAVLGLPGVPEVSGRSGRTLILGNLPHAPVPRGTPLASFADGGPTGARVIGGVLETLVRRVGIDVRIVLLCYSLSSRAGESLVESTARRLFAGRTVSWSPLTGAPMWRIAGSMSAVSPMSLRTGLPRKADCPYYTGEVRRESVRASYEALAARLASEGWEDLSYGVLDINSCAPREAGRR